MTARRSALSAVVVLVVLGLLGLSYVWATNGAFRIQRGPLGAGACSAPTAAWSAPNIPFEPVVTSTGTFRLDQALGDPVTSGLPQWPGVFDTAPTAYDLDGDGDEELIAHSNDANVYVFDTVTGRIVATIQTTCPHGWYMERVLNSVEVGVLRPGEPPSIIITNHAAYVSAWRFVPAESDDRRMAFERLWERRVNDCFTDAGMDAKPTLADVDGDGTLEVLVQTEELGFFALNTDGSVRWQQCWGGGNSEPIVHDLDEDGRLEAIVASDGGFLSVLDASTGRPLWTFNARDHGVFPASIAVSPTVAELDGKLPREILFTARHATSGDNAQFPSFHMGIFAVRQNLTTWQSELVWFRQPEWAHPLSYTRLVVADVDLDGAADVFGMDWNTIGHLPGNWENMGAAHVFRLDAQGQDVWVRNVDTFWSNKDILLRDLDEDGRPDLLVNGIDATLGDGLVRLSPLTGEQEAFVPVWPWKLMRGPSAHDLYHDGQLHIVFPAAPDVATPAHGALFVLEFDTA